MHTGACGLCKMQHLHIGAQVAVKQRGARRQPAFHRQGQGQNNLLRPIEGPAWHYRYRARLSVRYVRKKGGAGRLHERKSAYVADMRECHVLPQHVSDLLLPLRGLISSMDAREAIPQIELACGDDVTAMVLRHMEPLSNADLARLRAFAGAHPGVQWWVQSVLVPSGCLTTRC